MAHDQAQSILFRLPLEVRDMIYGQCHEAYEATARPGYSVNLIQRCFSNAPGLLLASKKTREEALLRMKHSISNVTIEIDRVLIPECLTLVVEETIGGGPGIKVDLEWSDFERDGCPALLNLMEHIFEEAPRVSILQIETLDYPKTRAYVRQALENAAALAPVLDKAKVLKHLVIRGSPWCNCQRQRPAPGPEEMVWAGDGVVHEDAEDTDDGDWALVKEIVKQCRPEIVVTDMILTICWAFLMIG